MDWFQFGQNLLLCHNLKSLGPILEGLCSIWQNFDPFWQKRYAIKHNSIVVDSHLVSLVAALNILAIWWTIRPTKTEPRNKTLVMAAEQRNALKREVEFEQTWFLLPWKNVLMKHSKARKTDWYGGRCECIVQYKILQNFSDKPIQKPLLLKNVLIDVHTYLDTKLLLKWQTF